jgi:hypothetical protein
MGKKGAVIIMHRIVKCRVIIGQMLSVIMIFVRAWTTHRALFMEFY